MNYAFISGEPQNNRKGDFPTLDVLGTFSVYNAFH